MNHPIDIELSHMLRGQYSEARRISDELEALGPEKIPQVNGQPQEETWLRHTFNRAWFLLQDGKLKESGQLFDAGRYIRTYGNPPLATSAPIFNPGQDSLDGKSVILAMEGGYGDEIIHVRFVRSLKEMGAKEVYVACSPGLEPLFSRIEGVTKIITRSQASTIAHDFWIPAFSAGWVCGHTFEDIPQAPYLSPNSESVKIWEQIIKSSKVKIGIRWAGSPKFEHQQFRKFPPEFLLNLARSDKVQLYSLQRDDNLIELPQEIIDLQHLLISWEDTAAAIENLDIVITSCTSVAHLAGAIGKETWVIVPILPYHVWTPGAPDSIHSPYYGEHVRIFRQKDPEIWNRTFQDLYEQFRARFDPSLPDLPSCDKQVVRLNLGCGHHHPDGFLNVDVNPKANPDQVVDLDQFPWPWADSEFQHIVAKDILEHLGSSPKDLVRIIQEMYRISENGAIWEVQFPHWRCDNAVNDPTHVRVITNTTFELFDLKKGLQRRREGYSDSNLAESAGVDIEVCDVQYEFAPHWVEQVKKDQITQEQLMYSLNTFNNVAESVRVLIQVHKPGRSL